MALLASPHQVLDGLRGAEPVYVALPVPERSATAGAATAAVAVAVAVPASTAPSASASASASASGGGGVGRAESKREVEITSISVVAASPPTDLTAAVPKLPSFQALAAPSEPASQLPVALAAPIAVAAAPVPAGPKRYTFDRLAENLAESDFADDVSATNSEDTNPATATSASSASASASAGAGGSRSQRDEDTRDALIDPHSAALVDAEPMPAEGAFFDTSAIAAIVWAGSMAVLGQSRPACTLTALALCLCQSSVLIWLCGGWCEGILIAFLNTALSDPSGLLYAASHSSAPAIGSAGAGVGVHELSAAHISTWHTAAYSIVFHFCFLVFGYAYRGVSARNVTLLQFSFLTILSVGTVLATACVASIGSLSQSTSTTVAPIFNSLRAWMVIPGQEAASFPLAFWIYVGAAGCIAVTAWYTAYRMRRTSLYVQKFPLRFPQAGHAMM